MKVLVIGATGLTGTHLVQKLLARGDDVTAFVRNPAGYAVKHDHLRVVQGEARDLPSIERACENQDAVLCAFGPRDFKKTDLQEVLMKNLIAAMKRAGVKRLVNLSAWGVGDSIVHANFPMKLFFSLVLKHLYADKARAEAHLFASDLDYVNVRPGQLTNKPARGGVRVVTKREHFIPTMTREDLADFMISQLESNQWIRQSPLIAY